MVPNAGPRDEGREPWDCGKQATERSNAQPKPDGFAALSDKFLGCPPCWACRSSQRLWDEGGEHPELVVRSSICGWWRGQCPRALPIAHGDDRSAEAPWSLSPRGDRPPPVTAHGPGWSPPSSRGFRAPTVRAAPNPKTQSLSGDVQRAQGRGPVGDDRLLCGGEGDCALAD